MRSLAITESLSVAKIALHAANLNRDHGGGTVHILI